MKKIFSFLFLVAVLGCNNKKHLPDVSSIKVDLPVERFDRDFFSIDTNHTEASLNRLNTKYPAFLTDYLYNILGALPQPDSVLKYTNLFRKDYQYVNETVQKKFSSFDPYKKEINRGFQFVKYYFPRYKIPAAIITFIGPLEGTASALTSSGLAIGLQSYLGKNFPAYQTEYISEVYPAYKSRRFEPAYISVNCFKNVIDDMYPPKTGGRPLVEQMIDAGKRLYVLDVLLPETADSLKTGYTQQQLEGCYKNEKNIWSFFIENNLELGTASPGFIGQFTGWQIVKKWMEKHPEISMDDLMRKDPKELLEESKYKAR
jgi:hypothetical protein